MNCSAELKVTAEADSEVLESAFFTADGKKVSKGLCGVIVSAVTCIDNGDF